MDLQSDSLNEILKTATIYRNGAFSYSYVCYHCKCSFTNISDTLDHIETHFDKNGEVLDVIEFIPEGVPDTAIYVSEPKLIDSEREYFKNEIHSQSEMGKNSFQDESRDGRNERLKDHDNVHQCKLCYHLCSTASQLLTHLMEEHLNASKLTCTFCCSENFLCKKSFEKHLLDHIMTKDVTFDALIENLLSKREICVKLEVEEYAPTSNNFVYCEICSLAFDTKSKLNLHMKQSHAPNEQKVVKRGIYVCDKCNRKIKGKILFYAHQYEHLIGGNRFNASEDITLLNNLKIFLDDNIQCDESTPTTPFGCKICGHMSVKRRKNIETHILQEHVYRLKCKTRTEKRYPCEYCGQKFTLSHNMIVHARIHTLEKPYTCLICNKSFSHSSYMKYHERVHSGIRPHQCSTCGLSFKSNTKLNMHNKIHSTETAICPICNKEFKPHRLNVHIRHVHQNEHRPYKCTVCLQAFKTSKTLKTHSYRHSGEKKYECRFQCNERFTSTAGRRGHERSKHETH